MNDDKLKNLGMDAGAKSEVFRYAERLRERMTPEESYLWAFLHKRPKGLKFIRQHPFGPYILDFYCHFDRIAIEGGIL